MNFVTQYNQLNFLTGDGAISQVSSLNDIQAAGRKSEFLVIPTLNNPRAGLARCKENNHV